MVQCSSAHLVVPQEGCYYYAQSDWYGYKMLRGKYLTRWFDLYTFREMPLVSEASDWECLAAFQHVRFWRGGKSDKWSHLLVITS